MTFTYSICHPEKEKVEIHSHPISGIEVSNIVENYPWMKKLKFSDSLQPDKIYHNPSLDFTCIENKRSFCLTANHDENKNLEFSLWYGRPRKVKILFGWFGEKEKWMVDDSWGFSLEEALTYLKYFVNGNYTLLEKLLEK